jgi:hypothetical protein
MNNANNANMFEQASRQKLRFATAKGDLSVEDLWDLPLMARNGFDLNTTAKTINRELKAAEEEDFVDSRPNPARAAHELRLEIVKYIISVKQRENQEALARQGKAAERARLVAALESKEQQELSGMSSDQIRARIAELDA